jgi:hypothetical protein
MHVPMESERADYERPKRRKKWAYSTLVEREEAALPKTGVPA